MEATVSRSSIPKGIAPLATGGMEELEATEETPVTRPHPQRLATQPLSAVTAVMEEKEALGAMEPFVAASRAKAGTAAMEEAAVTVAMHLQPPARAVRPTPEADRVAPVAAAEEEALQVEQVVRLGPTAPTVRLELIPSTHAA